MLDLLKVNFLPKTTDRGYVLPLKLPGKVFFVSSVLFPLCCSKEVEIKGFCWHFMHFLSREAVVCIVEEALVFKKIQSVSGTAAFLSFAFAPRVAERAACWALQGRSKGMFLTSVFRCRGNHPRAIQEPLWAQVIPMSLHLPPAPRLHAGACSLHPHRRSHLKFTEGCVEAVSPQPRTGHGGHKESSCFH